MRVARKASVVRPTGRTAALAAVATLLGACASSSATLKRTVPDMAAAVRGVKKVGVLPPDVRVYELTAAGPDELREDWSREAGALLAAAAVEALQARGFEARVLEPVPDTAGEIDEVRRLFRVVTADIDWVGRGADPLPVAYSPPAVVTRPAPAFPGKVSPPGPVDHRGCYSVGDLSGLAAFYGVDAFALIEASGEVSSGTRTAREVALIIVVNPFAIMGRTVYPGSWGVDRVDAAVVGRSGDVLWFARYLSQSTDLRSPSDATRATEANLEELSKDGVKPPPPPLPPEPAPGYGVPP